MTALLTATPVVRRIDNAVDSGLYTVDTALVLPSAANTIGKQYTVINQAASTGRVLLQASDGSLIKAVLPGTSTLVTPAQDAPTTSTQWTLLSADPTGLNAPQATAITLTATSPEEIYISSPTGAVTQVLPTTGVVAGKKFRLIVAGATLTNTVTLQSSSTGTIDIIGGSGFIQVQALIANPTTPAHWKVIDVYETAVSVFALQGATSAPNLTSNIQRRNKQVTISVDGTGSLTKDGTNSALLIGGVTTRFQPTGTQYMSVTGIVNNANTPLVMFMNASGNLGLYSISAGAASNFPATQTQIGTSNKYVFIYDLL